MERKLNALGLKSSASTPVPTSDERAGRTTNWEHECAFHPSFRTGTRSHGRLLATVCAVVPQPARGEPRERSPANLLMSSKRSSRILAATTLIDGHNDLAEQLRDRWTITQPHRPRAPTQARWRRLRTDILRLRRGLVGGVFLAAYVPANLSGPAAVPVLFEQIRRDPALRRALRAKDLSLALTASDVERIHRSGRVAVLIRRRERRRAHRQLARGAAPGVRLRRRYLTLTHSKNTTGRRHRLASVAPNAPNTEGLTRFWTGVVLAR